MVGRAAKTEFVERMASVVRRQTETEKETEAEKGIGAARETEVVKGNAAENEESEKEAEKEEEKRGHEGAEVGKEAAVVETKIEEEDHVIEIEDAAVAEIEAENGVEAEKEEAREETLTEVAKEGEVGAGAGKAEVDLKAKVISAVTELAWNQTNRKEEVRSQMSQVYAVSIKEILKEKSKKKQVALETARKTILK